MDPQDMNENPDVSANEGEAGEKPQDEGEADIEEFIEILEEHCKNCENEGKYVEAEMAKNRIKELKEQKKQMDLEELLNRQQNENIELEETHILEFNNFNQDWDKRMNAFQVHSSTLIKDLEQKHINKHEEWKEKLDERIPIKFKPSSELLNLRRIQINLAKQKEYKEAHQVQIRAQKLEKEEQASYNEDRNGKIMKSEEKLFQQQDNEMEALRKRIIAGENEQKKQRALELERMFQRYQNVKKELENQHKMEKIRLEKGQSFDPNASRMSRMSARPKTASSRGGPRSSAKKNRAAAPPSNSGYGRF
ncbi:unnamed protein product [Moneuplotes crassus]|uniref:Uncharacterized protein n=1 Tax=Euplotes crassus TaxID=5936 RepID=A0AAD1XNV5_EUPCR|nr:unnamed protein product [Moneuplotes crassus]